MDYHFSVVVGSKEELARAEVEIWNRTHYRLDWLLYRTLGYALLSSTLAIYIFWAETGFWTGREQNAATIISLSATWILLLGLAMLWYDFHTRVSYETWPEVRRRLSRHLVVSLLSFAGALVIANGIHGVSVLIDKANTPKSYFSDPTVKHPDIPARTVRWRKGGPRDPAVIAAKAAADKAGTKTPETAATPSKTTIPPATKPATNNAAKKALDPTAKTGTATVKKTTQAKPTATTTKKKPTAKSPSTSSKRRSSKNRSRRYR